MPDHPPDNGPKKDTKDWKKEYHLLKKKYESILDNIGDTYIELDLSGRTIFISDSSDYYLGYTKEEFMGISYKEYMPPETAQEVYKVYNRVYKTGIPEKEFEYASITKDGTLKYVKDTIILRRDESGKPIGFASFTQDITEKKLNEIALRESEAKYRNVLENIGDAYAEVDLSGTVTFLNWNAALILGYNQEEFVGMNYKEFSSPDGTKRLFDIFQNVYKTGKPNTKIEYELIAKDGSTKIIDAYVDLLKNSSGDVIGFQTVSRDITDQKIAETELIKSEEKYRTILDNMLEGYVEISLKGKVTFTNKAAAKSMGYTKEEFLGVPYRKLYRSEEDIQKTFNLYNSVYKTGKPVLAPEEVRVTKGGTIKTFEMYVDLMRNQAGEPIGFRTMRRDITEKKKTEDALRKSEEKHRNILDNMLEGYIESDLKGNTIFVNKVGSESMGYTKEEYVGMNYKEFSTTDVAEETFKVYNKVYKTGDPEFIPEQHRFAKDGSHKIFEAYVDLIRNPVGDPIGFRTIRRDITEKKKAEMALKQSEEKYKNILDNMLEGYTEQDLKGNIVFVNNAAAKELGYTKEEFIGMNYQFLSSPDTPEETMMIYNNVYKTSKPAKREAFKLIAKDGTLKIFESYVDLVRDESNIPIGFRTLTRNITEKKMAEIELKKSEKKYRDIINNMVGSYLEMDLNGNITFSNKRVYEFLGCTEIDFSTTKEYRTPEEFKRMTDIFKDIYKTREPKKLIENEIILKDGTRKTVETSIWLRNNDKGKPIGFSLISNDITDRKQQEEEKKKLEKQLQYAQKMESIGTLAGGIAHDFNNLLMGILGLNSLMMADTDTSHPHHEYLTEVESYIKNAVDLTRQLLGFARGGKYEVKPTDLNEILKTHNRMFSRTRKEITIKGTYDNNLWITEVDQSQLRQVLMNIYLNAWQAMPNGGDLYVKTENVILDENYVVPFYFKPGKYIQISITDNGIGMDENTLQRVFDPFFTTREKERGTGLGLPSALGIIKNHGGFITVYSEPGEGSTFNIYLPASIKKKVDEETTEEIAITGSGTVLIIDDETMILNVGEKILNRLGYDVMTAKDGNEGLDKYSKNMEKIDLVILDMIMPGISGSDIYESLKKLNPDVKVLLASGYSLDGKAKSLLDKGCNGFIQKPFNMKQLSQKISEILAG